MESADEDRAELPSDTRDWLTRRTCHGDEWNARHVCELKHEQRVSVVLPARNESDTIGAIIDTIRASLMQRVPLVDEIVVIDSHSSDNTALIAKQAGAAVVHQDGIRPELAGEHGKGDALWKSLFVATGDLIVFLDSDVRGFTPSFVTGLLGPLLSDERICYTKACYDRLRTDGPGSTLDGGRVTELVARPLLNLHWPHLAGFVQPLSGEAAGRRDVLRRVPFATGYGVEIGLLVDLAELLGLEGLAQVDMGQREHRHQSTADLGVMAAHVQATAMRRLGVLAEASECTPDSTLVQYERGSGSARSFQPRPRLAGTMDRPPHILFEENPADPVAEPGPGLLSRKH